MVFTARRFEHLIRCFPLAGVAEPADAAVAVECGADLVVALIAAGGQAVDGRAAVRRVERLVSRLAAFRANEIFLAAHRAAAGRPGVSLGIARISPRRRQVAFTGLGNVYGAVAGHCPTVLVGQPGTVGVGRRKVPETQVFPWRDGDLLALASDGLVDAWDLASLWRLGDLPLDRVVDRIAGCDDRLPEDASLVLARTR